MIVVETSGPLFEGQIHVARGTRLGVQRAITAAQELARGHLRARTRYSTPKYGHAAESVKSRVETVAGAADQIIGRAYIGGPAAFLAPWLEHGTKAHPIPSVRVRGVGNRRQRHRANVTLAIPMGGGFLFRASADHRGARAFRWASQTQAEINQRAPEILRQALAESGAT